MSELRGQGLVIVIVLLTVGVGLAAVSQRTCSHSPESLPSVSPAGPGGQRIICMAPNITETVFALGEGQRVVAVTDFTFFPPEAARLPTVGGYIDPNFERIARLEPDLIIIQGEHEQLTTFCRSRAVPILTVDMNSLPTIYQGIRDIGTALGRTEQAATLVGAIQAELRQVHARVAERSRPTVFVSLGRKVGSLSGLFTTGDNSFVGELIELAGGDNIFKELTGFYPQITKEALLKRAPRIILDCFPGQPLTPGDREQILKDWQVLASIPAVETKSIHIITADYFLIPGPRVAMSVHLLAAIFHPDRFPPASE